MEKLSMKKLGTPESDPPRVEGNGGVSAEGEIAFPFAGACAPASPLAGCFPEGLAGDGPSRPWTTAVGCWDRCVRTSGAGTVVVSVVAVDVGALGVAGVAGLALVGAGSDGGGAGTVVTSEAGAEGSVEVVTVVEPVPVVASANAAPTGSQAASTARARSTGRGTSTLWGTSGIAMSARRIIAVSCRADS
jgi:hypothetical protein